MTSESLSALRLQFLARLSPEIQLLCACCRVNPRDADLELQASLATSIDSDVLMSTAIRHRVEPLLYHNLKRHAPGVFSSELLAALAARVSRNAIKSLRALRINVQLSRLMRRHDIEFLPLKGVTLAKRYYGNIGLRHCNDIDFWVPEHSVDAVRALLLAEGCRPCPEHDLQDIEARGTRHKKFLRRLFHHDVLIHQGGESLELHWRLASNAKGLLLDPIDLLKTGEPVDAGGEPIYILDPVSMLLYLCDHGARHGWYRLKWLVDLPQLLESCEWDWHDVLARSRQANCHSALLLGLKLAQHLFGWVAPDAVVAEMAKVRLLNWQVSVVCVNLCKPSLGTEVATLFQSAKHFFYRISIAENFAYLRSELEYYFLKQCY